MKKSSLKNLARAIFIFALLLVLTPIGDTARAACDCRNCKCCNKNSDTVYFSSMGKPAQGAITILNTTGTTPDSVGHRAYTIMAGDKFEASLIIQRLIEPDYMDLSVPEGFEDLTITGYTTFDNPASQKTEWEPASETRINPQTIRINMSNLPEKTDYLSFKFTCTASAKASSQHEGQKFTATYYDRQLDGPCTLESTAIHGLQMRLKTVDLKKRSDESFIDIYSGQYVQSGAYALYYDEALTKPVTFIQGDAEYNFVAVPDDGSYRNTMTTLNNSLGLINVKGLREGDYYLVQNAAPNGYNTLQNPIKITLSGEYKFDPNDPANQTNDESPSVFSHLAKILESIDKDPSQKEREAREKEQKNQRLMKEIATYHAVHPKEIVSHVDIEKDKHATIKNSDLNADVIVQYNTYDGTGMLLTYAAVIAAIAILFTSIHLAYQKTKKKPATKS